MQAAQCRRRSIAQFAGRGLAATSVLVRVNTAALVLIGALAASVPPLPSAAQTSARTALPIKERNMVVSRSGAAARPRNEREQAVVDGWPLYRTERGQVAFNDAMATLKATEGRAPAAAAFKGCAGLQCELTLPAIDADGWMQPGRIWISPTEYVLFVHSPRLRDGQSYRRRSIMSMRYFVFHEFHNGTHNTDPYDTISSHKSSVFVPLYMSKQATDVYGRNFVIVTQVAPHDVSSIHASNLGSAGPGIEVAKNVSDQLEPLQGHAGILVATIVKTAIPRLQVINHRGSEGRPMLDAYERRMAALRGGPAAPAVALPFVAAIPQRVTSATGTIDDLILRPGATPRIAIADREVQPKAPVLVQRGKTATAGVVPAKAAATARPVDAFRPTLIEQPRLVTRQAQQPEPALVEEQRPATRPALRRSNNAG